LQPFSNRRDPAGNHEARSGGHGGERACARCRKACPPDGGARLEAGREDSEENGLNFEYSREVQELRRRLIAFMKEQVHPAEPKWEAHVRSERRWEPVPVIEELKAKARAAGLWNLWRPKSHGGTLTNLE